jgi:hypothetical protein
MSKPKETRDILGTVRENIRYNASLQCQKRTPLESPCRDCGRTGDQACGRWRHTSDEDIAWLLTKVKEFGAVVRALRYGAFVPSDAELDRLLEES